MLGLGFSLPVRPRGREFCCSFTFFASSSPIFNPAFCGEPRIQRMTRRRCRTCACNPLDIRLFFPTGFSTTERDCSGSLSTLWKREDEPRKGIAYGTISADMFSALCIQLARGGNNMKQAELIQKYVSVRLLTMLGLFFSIAWSSKAVTITNGNLCGTWSPAGNPYIVTDTSIVPASCALSIEPGVVVWIGSDVSINVNGLIQAVGNSNLEGHITFGPIGVDALNWATINVNSSAGTHLFKFCDFSNANVAITVNTPTADCDVMYCTFQNVGDGIDMIAPAYTGYAEMASKIMNCTFSNCTSPIWGNVWGRAGFVYAYSQSLNVVVKNCLFNGNGNGCVLAISGQDAGMWVQRIWLRQFANHWEYFLQHNQCGYRPECRQLGR